ncbi:MAG: thiamine pyrophosphate-binding protein [Dehalococcoidia bacterium]|nr:thiamine pyrophosphate-binding protein [Dehalococcoidia bacterium]
MTDKPASIAHVIGGILKEEGVEHAFGVYGSGVIFLYTGASDNGVKLVNMRHEQAAAFAADAYARAKRRPSVCMLMAGPGYTYASSGIAQAYYAKSPVVALVAQHATFDDMKGASAKSYAAEALKGIAKLTTRVVEKRLVAHHVKRAFIEASAYPPGPVVVEIPENFLASQRDVSEQLGYQKSYLHEPPVPGGSDSKAVERAVMMLLEAERPVIVGGDEIYWSGASPELNEFVELVQCPVMTRRMARGAVPENHPLAFGGRARGDVLAKADVAMTIGLSLGYLENFGEWTRHTKLIQACHSEQEIHCGSSTELVLLGDAKAVLKQMIDCAKATSVKSAKRQAWLDTVAGIKSTNSQKLIKAAEKTSAASPIHPAFLAKEIVEFLDDSATIVFDALVGSSSLTERIESKFAGQILDTGEWITIGHGVGMGIGAQLARPGKQVFVMMGDGGIGAGGFDIETAIRCRLPVVYLINNNSSWLSSMTDNYCRELRLADGRIGNVSDLTPGVRYDRVFEPFGCHVEHVEQPQDIRPALERSFNSGKTSVIDVVVDRHVIHPMFLRGGQLFRAIGPDRMSEFGRRAAFPELFPKKDG